MSEHGLTAGDSVRDTQDGTVRTVKEVTEKDDIKWEDSNPNSLEAESQVASRLRKGVYERV